MVSLPDGALAPSSLPTLTKVFAETYRTLYTRVVEGAAIEVLSFRVRASGPEPQIALSGAVAGNTAGAALKGHRPAYFDGKVHNTPAYDRSALAPGLALRCPSSLEARAATHRRAASAPCGRSTWPSPPAFRRSWTIFRPRRCSPAMCR